jgi:hypothetical protein
MQVGSCYLGKFQSLPLRDFLWHHSHL